MVSSGFCSGVTFCAVLIVSLLLASRSLLEQVLFSPVFPAHNLDTSEGAVFITGCSSGIGRQTALDLVNLGYVVFCTVRKQLDADALVEAVSDRSLIHPLLCDVTNENQITDARNQVSSWLESASKDKRRNLIGIVNNAGRMPPPDLMEEDSSIQNYDQVMAVNVRGPLQIYQAFIPLLRKSDPKGRIVNIGSLAGQAARPFRGPYTVSKFALEGLSDTLRQELLLEHISVSMVNPGYVKTEIADKGGATVFQEKIDSGGVEKLSEVQRRMFDGSKAYMEKAFETASSVADVSSDIIHALLDPRPRTRYYPGKVAMGPITASFLAKLLPLVPDRMMDKLVVKIAE